MSPARAQTFTTQTGGELTTVQPKNNARARTSFCVRKKKFFSRLIAGRLGLNPGNRNNFLAAAG